MSSNVAIQSVQYMNIEPTTGIHGTNASPTEIIIYTPTNENSKEIEEAIEELNQAVAAFLRHPSDSEAEALRQYSLILTNLTVHETALSEPEKIELIEQQQQVLFLVARSATESEVAQTLQETYVDLSILSITNNLETAGNSERAIEISEDLLAQLGPMIEQDRDNQDAFETLLKLITFLMSELEKESDTVKRDAIKKQLNDAAEIINLMSSMMTQMFSEMNINSDGIAGLASFDYSTLAEAIEKLPPDEADEVTTMLAPILSQIPQS